MNKENRQAARITVNIPIKIPRFAIYSTFPGLKKLLNCNWRVVDLSCLGLQLEAKSLKKAEFEEYLDQLLKKFFKKVIEKKSADADIEYQVVPPVDLKMSIEVKIPPTEHIFTFNGSMVWFRICKRGIYKMGIKLKRS